ncbi:MAG: XRE family transcriptional regulator [Candidatus Ratteibacteria bacterium]
MKKRKKKAPIKREHLRRLRLSKGYSLGDLANAMGNIVTRQALFRYEDGSVNPSRKVEERLAEALGVKKSQLWRKAEHEISCVYRGYRRTARIPVKEKTRVQEFVAQKFTAYIRLQAWICPEEERTISLPRFSLSTLEDAETAAMMLRKQWDLGIGPIANVVALLESKNIFVIDIDADKRFDGLAVFAYGMKKKPIAAAVVNRTNTCGERQRLSLLHELGHLILDIPKGMDKELAAFRFGAAFLAPAVEVISRVGENRSLIRGEELLLLKRYFGMSVQALLYRLHHLKIINQACFTRWYTEISALGWKRTEPFEMPPEQGWWFYRKLMKCLSEGVVTMKEIEEILDEVLSEEEKALFMNRTSYLRMTPSRRRKYVHDNLSLLAPNGSFFCPS